MGMKKPERNRVAFDMDGVLSDYVTPFTEFCREQYDPNLPDPDRQSFMGKNWGWGSGMIRTALTDFGQSGALLHLPTLPGVERLAELEEMGLTLEVRTARHPSNMDDTQAWLMDKIPWVRFARVVGGRYAKVLDTSFLAGVDDHPKHVLTMYGSGALVVAQMNTPHNQHVEDRTKLLRVNNLDRFIDLVKLLDVKVNQEGVVYV